MGNKSSTDKNPISTDTCDISTKYHTVEVSKDLPNVNKNYPCDKPKDLPPSKYWMNQIKLQESKKYKEIQHIMANGPRESFKK